MEIQDKTILLAFEIISKKPRQRNEQEKLWLKLHGGARPFETFKRELEFAIRVNAGELGPCWNKRKENYDFYKPTKPYQSTLDSIIYYLKEYSIENFGKVIEETRKVSRYLENKDNKLGKKYTLIGQEVLKIKEFLDIQDHIPLDKIEETIDFLKKRRREWRKIHNQKIIDRKNEKEKLRLIKKFKLDENLSYEEVKEIEADIKRKKLGIGEKGNLKLSTNLMENINKDLKNVEGYLYIRTWKINKQTQWFKIGITNDLERREMEQNVLPVAAKTLATAKVASMDHARSIEQSIHKVMEDFKINNANNNELFKLKPDDLASLIEIFKKIDIGNK